MTPTERYIRDLEWDALDRRVNPDYARARRILGLQASWYDVWVLAHKLARSGS